ncbi:hypothetical protein BH23ACT2_BH23ACT2_31020 [soil metagenome]
MIRQVVTPAPPEAWSAIVRGDALAMPDHGRDWFTSMAVRGPWRDASRLYRLHDGGEVLLPLVTRAGPSRALTVAASPPTGCGFGGLVGDRARDPEVLDAVLSDVASQGWLSLRIRPIPETGSTVADASSASAHVVARRAHLLDLAGDLDEVFARMRKSTRRTIRRHQDGSRGFVVEEACGDVHLDTYESLRQLSVRRWAETSKEPLVLARWRANRGEPDRVLRDLAGALGDRFRTWVAWADGKPAAVNIMATGSTAHVMRASMDHELVGSSGLMQYLDWLAVERAHASLSHTINLGESGTSSSLSSYKESLGAVAHDYTEVRFERIPISSADAAGRQLVKRMIGFRDPA